MSSSSTGVQDDVTVADFAVRRSATTRWSDNDMYGHLNNAVYYQLFDTAINGWIIERTAIDPVSAPTLGVVVESGCRYLQQVHFPQALEIGLRVARLGRSSVTYDLALFNVSVPESPVAARGRWVHVYVDPKSRRPVPIPDGLRALFETITVL